MTGVQTCALPICPQPQSVADDRQRRCTHGEGGEDRPDQDAEEREQDTRRDRHADAVVDQREEQVLLDIAHGRLRQPPGPDNAVEIALDQGQAGALDGDIGADSSFTSVTRLREGVHELTCTATDGRFTVSDTVLISVGNDAPTVVITLPTGLDPLYSGNAIGVHAQARDVNGNLDTVYWQVINSLGFPTGWTSTGEDTTIPRSQLAPGRYTLVATAYDTAGERAQDTMTIVIQENPANLGPSIDSLTVVATPADSFDSEGSYWADQCAVDVTGDGRVDASDLCQRLRFTASVTDDHDPVSALTFEWKVYEGLVLVDTFTTSTPSTTIDFVPGDYKVELRAFDTAGEPSERTPRSFVVTTLF